METAVNLSKKEQLQKIESETPRVIQIARGIVISSEKDQEDALELCRKWKARFDFADEYFGDDIKKAFELHRSLTKKRKDIQEPYAAAIRIVSGRESTSKINIYKDEVERKAQAEARKRADEAAKERVRLISIEQGKITKMLAVIGKKEDQLLALQEELEAKNITDERAEVVRVQIEVIQAGIEDKAEAAELARQKVDESISMPDPTSLPAVETTVKGIAKKKFKAVEVTNQKLLLQAIVNGQVPIGCIKSFDLVAITKLKNMGQTVPGVAFEMVRATRL